jgi:hypothetical protein
VIKKQDGVSNQLDAEPVGSTHNTSAEGDARWRLPAPQCRDAVALDAAQLGDLAREYDVVPVQYRDHKAT